MLPVLRRGAQGPEVKLLQERLAGAGFRPGMLDGRFGPATEAALLAFQRSHDLLPDGVVGPATWRVLEEDGGDPASDRSSMITPELVAEMFPLTPLGAIRRHLPSVLAGLRQYRLVDKPMLLMALATIRAEAEGFTPVAEHVSRFNTSPEGHPFDLYDHRRDLGNHGPPDGARYRGRGFVQLTGAANYRHYGRQLKLPLAREPDLALEPRTAGLLLGAFLAERRRAIKLALIDDDLAGARRLINGGRHGLNRFTEAWRVGDRLLDDPVWPARRTAMA